ncbi:MAG TPA: bifunctional riboflavin kinase/FAD synthetase [Candidatus Hydrogenedentes bacterium]|nr:bifunctional riboflavin kinase/FAD synthetase [Candidatus Hydrogenedentota bacterium]
MQVIEDVARKSVDRPQVALTIGSFDGVHLGHRRLLAELIDIAKARQQRAAVLTMRPHPREIFAPTHAPNLLTCERKKRQLLEEAGVDALLFLEFTKDTADLEPAAFAETIIRDRCNAKTVVVGHDFRFGRAARGDYAFLKDAGHALGFSVHRVPPLFIEGERVSSTLIRERILQGDIGGAETFLGRKYSLTGHVIPGHGIGRKLGFPTANIAPRHSAVPAQGVYVAEAVLEAQTLPAAVNIGIAPTIRQKDIVIEAHVLDFTSNLLGSEIEIRFHKRLRSEQKFSTHEALCEQIRRDVAAVRQYFAQAEPVPRPSGG